VGRLAPQGFQLFLERVTLFLRRFALRGQPANGFALAFDHLAHRRIQLAEHFRREAVGVLCCVRFLLLFLFLFLLLGTGGFIAVLFSLVHGRAFIFGRVRLRFVWLARVCPAPRLRVSGLGGGLRSLQALQQGLFLGIERAVQLLGERGRSIWSGRGAGAAGRGGKGGRFVTHRIKSPCGLQGLTRGRSAPRPHHDDQTRAPSRNAAPDLTRLDRI
jgi:hypothetical protein